MALDQNNYYSFNGIKPLKKTLQTWSGPKNSLAVGEILKFVDVHILRKIILEDFGCPLCCI